MRRIQAQPRIPIIFQEEKNSTKTKLAKLLKQYNACMTFNPDENTYEVDVQVKFSSVGEKMQFMQNYLKKPGADSVLEEQEHNHNKKYHTEAKEEKALMDFSSIKKATELEYSASQHELEDKRNPQLVDSVVEEGDTQLNYASLELLIEESIERSCEEILLRKIRPDMASQKQKRKQSSNNNEEKKVVSDNQKNALFNSKPDGPSIPDYRQAFIGKSKQQIIQEINVDLVKSNQEYSKGQFGGIVMQENMLFQESEEEDSSYKIGANRNSEMSYPSQLFPRNNQSAKAFNDEVPKQEKKEFMLKSQGNKASDKQIKIDFDQSKKINWSTIKQNNPISKEEYHRMMAEKQSESQLKSKPNSSKQSKHGKHLPVKSLTSSSLNSNRSHSEYKPNKIQHEQFKSFLLSHRDRLDSIVQSYKKDDQQILIEDEPVFNDMNSSRDFSAKIIDQYKEKIEVNNQNMSSSQMVGYFRFLIRHAKGLYVDFQKQKK